MILTLSCLAAAESVESVGYLRIVNAVAPGSGNVSVRVDGVAIYPRGYAFGAVTGGVGLPPGVHKVAVFREGVRDGNTNVTVVKNLTMTLVVYAEEIPARDGMSVVYQARWMTLALRDVSKGKVATFVSFSRVPLLRVELREPADKWRVVEVARLGTIETPVALARGYVALRSRGRPLDAISVAESGNYGVVLFDDAEGRLRSVSFRDSGEFTDD